MTISTVSGSSDTEAVVPVEEAEVPVLSETDAEADVCVEAEAEIETEADAESDVEMLAAPGFEDTDETLDTEDTGVSEAVFFEQPARAMKSADSAMKASVFLILIYCTLPFIRYLRQKLPVYAGSLICLLLQYRL
ncbi:MAG: hypothetical protein K5796_05940 [Lachnospiraceae bacterium]|nr:hypothetical protein [Lachnospiraceae bacterium]